MVVRVWSVAGRHLEDASEFTWFGPPRELVMNPVLLDPENILIRSKPLLQCVGFDVVFPGKLAVGVD